MTRRGPDCPSDLRFDQLRSGELSGKAAEACRSHVAGCVDCARRFKALDEAATNFLGRDVGPAVAAIHAASGGRVPEEVAVAFGARSGAAKPPAWRSALWAFLGAAVTAGVAVAVWPRPEMVSVVPLPSPVEPELIRVKGSLGLVVHRARGSETTTLFSGDSARPGDRLSFEVDLPADGFVMVLGVEASGQTYVSYPLAGAAAAPVSGGDDQTLPGSAELDDSVGNEHLALIWCPAPFTAGELGWQDRSVTAPAGCQATALDLVKSPP